MVNLRICFNSIRDGSIKDDDGCKSHEGEKDRESWENVFTKLRNFGTLIKAA